MLSSADGWDLMKLANRTGGFGHVNQQGMRKFKISTVDKKDHPIPPPPPPGGGQVEGAPTYVISWNSSSLFGRGGGGLPLTSHVQVIILFVVMKPFYVCL